MASKSKSRRRVFRASCILAALIVAGSSFAWFTSKDEVTNRLSATADYGVAIAEDFQPPENWIPGQAVNKDVAAVNTGNIDAFARMWVEGEMSVLARTSQANSAVANGTITNKITPVTDTKYTSINLNYTDDNGLYYRELSQDKEKNPDLNDNGTTAESGDSENIPARFSEVQAMQAGAYLVGVPANAEFYYVVEHACTVKAYEDTNTGTAELVYDLKEGDVIATKGAVLPDGTPATGNNKVFINAGTTGLNIDSSQFYPQTEGNYIFRRNVGLTKTVSGANGVNEKDDYEYSGYYYIPKSGDALLKSPDSTADHYIALYTSTDGDSDKSDYTIPDNSVTETSVTPSKEVVGVTPTDNLKFYNAKEKIVQNSDLKWVYTAPVAAQAGPPAVAAQPAKLTAYYAGGDSHLGIERTGGSGTTQDPYTYTDYSADDIAVEITLANVGTAAQEWTAINGTGSPETWYTDTNGTSQNVTTGQNTTFYYNDDIEAGDTATILIDSVKLADATKKDAYMAFDFDLNVKLESVQITVDEDGQEMVTPVTEWAATTGNTSAYAADYNNYLGNGTTARYKGNEIAQIQWDAADGTYTAKAAEAT